MDIYAGLRNSTLTKEFKHFTKFAKQVLSRLISDVIVKLSYHLWVSRFELTTDANVGVDLEVIVQGCIVGVASLSKVEKRWEYFAWISGKILKLLLMHHHTVNVHSAHIL